MKRRSISRRRNPVIPARSIVKAVSKDFRNSDRNDVADWMSVNSEWVYATVNKHMPPTTPRAPTKTELDAVARLRSNLFSVITELSA